MAKINKEKESYLTLKRLKELLEYDSETGLFYWLVVLGRKIKIGSLAGSLSKSDGYVEIKVNGYHYKAHRLAWLYIHGEYPKGKQPFIDHVNGKRDDNRIVNLRVSSQHENQRNQKMSSNNKSGITGVSCVGFSNNSKKNPKINYYWSAYWYDEKGKQMRKLFSVHGLGEEGAKQAAIDYRTEQIRLLELNQGIIYSGRHGT